MDAYVVNGAGVMFSEPGIDVYCHPALSCPLDAIHKGLQDLGAEPTHGCMGQALSGMVTVNPVGTEGGAAELLMELLADAAQGVAVARIVDSACIDKCEDQLTQLKGKVEDLGGSIRARS